MILVAASAGAIITSGHFPAKPPIRGGCEQREPCRAREDVEMEMDVNQASLWGCQVQVRDHSN